jgi:polar amino acid transport system substrate-binding protein/glutamate/aspartate transport system substrate-binding protein
MRRLAATALLAVTPWAVAFADCPPTLDRLATGGTLTLGVRADAPPFSEKRDDGSFAGYTVSLCRRIASEVGARLAPQTVEVAELAVTGQSRFEALASCRIDLLCEATTVTLSRLKDMAFTQLVFASGVGLLYHADGPSEFSALAGKKVGVLAGTTAEAGLPGAFERAGIEVEIVRFASHDEGIAAMRSRAIEAYFADRSLLVAMAREQDLRGAGILVGDITVSYEPYAIALRQGDRGLQQIAVETLARLYRSREIEAIYADAFDGHAPGETTRMIYLLGGLPE